MFKKDHKFKTSKQDKRGAIYRFLGAFLVFALAPTHTLPLFADSTILAHFSMNKSGLFVKNK